MIKSTKDIPKIKSFKPIAFPSYTKEYLSNGAPVYILHSNDYEVIKLEMNFRAGRLFEKSWHGVARACAHQIREGAGEYNSEDIASITEFYGATLQTNGGMDYARLELYSLCKHLDHLLPIVSSVLTSPHFPEEELASYKRRNIRRLALDLAKNDIVAYRTLTELLFGKDHPYGYNSGVNTIRHLDKALLLEHFNKNYKNAPFSVILAGGINDHILKNIDDRLGSLPYTDLKETPHFEVKSFGEERTRMKGPQRFQSSIRLGRILFDRSHPDYPAMYVLNTILGGYFGSRLMSNIREDKGLTYDIYSSLDMLWQEGYLMIGAEVDNENIEVTLAEIYHEFEKLKQNPVTESELQLVKNYINGNLLNLMNGPFNSIQLIRLIALYGQGMEFFEFFMAEIHMLDAKRLQDVACKYLNKEDFKEVVVGKS